MSRVQHDYGTTRRAKANGNTGQDELQWESNYFEVPVSWCDNGIERRAMTEFTEDSTTIDGDSIPILTADFAETARILMSAGSVTDTLARVVELAVGTIEGCDFAGLFLIEEGVVSTPVHTDPVVVEVDALQHLTGEGPCLDAITYRAIFYAHDVGDDQRWPHFGPQATTAGIRSVLALPLADDDRQGALNLYARYPSAFGVVDRGKAVILASLATLALSAAHSHEGEERRIENLRAALISRELIGQAEGILMQRERITANAAFDILRRASQHLNLKLREVAQSLVETGEGPETGPPRS
jgi:ANTAR domain/GAF domain